MRKSIQRQAYSVKEVAQMLGVSEKTIRSLIDKKEIRSIRLGTNERAPVRIPAIELTQLLNPDL